MQKLLYFLIATLILFFIFNETTIAQDAFSTPSDSTLSVTTLTLPSPPAVLSQDNIGNMPVLHYGAEIKILNYAPPKDLVYRMPNLIGRNLNFNSDFQPTPFEP